MTNATAILSIRSTSSILNMLNIESFFFSFFFFSTNDRIMPIGNSPCRNYLACFPL